MTEFVSDRDNFWIMTISARINRSGSGRSARRFGVQQELSCATIQQQDGKTGQREKNHSQGELHWRACAKRRAMVFQMSEVLLVIMPSTPMSSRLLARSGSLMV